MPRRDPRATLARARSRALLSWPGATTPDDPDSFMVNIHDILGEDYPYFTAIGNHDEDAWSGANGYESVLTQQLQRANVTQYCVGDVGENHACYYKGLYFVMSGIGTQGTGHVQFIEDAFDAVPAQWKLCGWHKNQRQFQLNTKSDETGYAVYDTCRAYGAIVATGHEHSYSRTYTMNSFSQQIIKDFNETVNLDPGNTFCFVSGLGGESIRSWDDDLAANPWWAAIAASDNNVSDGALFCTFKPNGDAKRATCYFEDRSGDRYDEFDIVSNLPADVVAKSNDICYQPFYEVAIDSVGDDAIEQVPSGRVIADQRILRIGTPEVPAGTIAAFRFNNVPVERNARIELAQVQLYGLVSDLRVKPALNVRVELVDNAAPINANVAHDVTKRTFTSPISWTTDGEDFEALSVWNTVNIAPLLREVVALPGWKAGNSVLITIEGEAALMAAAVDRNNCQAPTLAIELARDC